VPNAVVHARQSTATHLPTGDENMELFKGETRAGEDVFIVDGEGQIESKGPVTDLGHTIIQNDQGIGLQSSLYNFVNDNGTVSIEQISSIETSSPNGTVFNASVTGADIVLTPVAANTNFDMQMFNVQQGS